MQFKLLLTPDRYRDVSSTPKARKQASKYAPERSSAGQEKFSHLSPLFPLISLSAGNLCGVVNVPFFSLASFFSVVSRWQRAMARQLAKRNYSARERGAQAKLPVAFPLIESRTRAAAMQANKSVPRSLSPERCASRRLGHMAKRGCIPDCRPTNVNAVANGYRRTWR